MHFAHVLIDGKYLQVLTEFDGDPMAYTELFRQELGPVFREIVSLVEGAPPWDELDDPTATSEYTRGLNLNALGAVTTSDEDRGYLFSAVGDTAARETTSSLSQRSSSPA